MQLANALDAQAQVLRALASGVMETGCPVDVPWGAAGTKSLHQFTSLDLLDEATTLETDAAKLRLLYS